MAVYKITRKGAPEDEKPRAVEARLAKSAKGIREKLDALAIKNGWKS